MSNAISIEIEHDQDNEIKILNILATGFAATMAFNNRDITINSMGHVFKKEPLEDIKRLIERFVANGFDVEVVKKGKEV